MNDNFSIDKIIDNLPVVYRRKTKKEIPTGAMLSSQDMTRVEIFEKYGSGKSMCLNSSKPISKLFSTFQNGKSI